MIAVSLVFVRQLSVCFVICAMALTTVAMMAGDNDVDVGVDAGGEPGGEIATPEDLSPNAARVARASLLSYARSKAETSWMRSMGQRARRVGD